jgi:hypothetical protein
MTTGPKAARDAAKILRDPKATDQDKTAAASDLAQAKRTSATRPSSPVRRKPRKVTGTASSSGGGVKGASRKK